MIDSGFNQYRRELVNCDKDAVRIINKSFLWLQKCLGRKIGRKEKVSAVQENNGYWEDRPQRVVFVIIVDLRESKGGWDGIFCFGVGDAGLHRFHLASSSAWVLCWCGWSIFSYKIVLSLSWISILFIYRRFRLYGISVDRSIFFHVSGIDNIRYYLGIYSIASVHKY